MEALRLKMEARRISMLWSQFLDHFAEDPDPHQSERSDPNPTTGSGAVLSLPA
jgi:hypothetical protein